MLKRVSAAAVVVFALAFIALLWSSFPTTTLAKEERQKREKRQNGSQVENRPSLTFTNPAPITIVDGATANPYPSTIAVAGISGNIPATAGSVKVTLNGFSHSFPDDVAMVLVGPTGAALLLQDGGGGDPDMANVTYTLSDTGAAFLPNATAWPAGTYKPTSYYTEGTVFPPPGPGAAHGYPGPNGTATFSSIFAGTNPNGNWNLYIADFAAGDVGSLSGGWTLEIIPGAAPPSNDAPVDINGDGRTDFVTVRNVGGGTSGQARWYTMFQDGFPSSTTSAPTTTTDWGIASDEFIPADYDGDGKDDFAVFRPGVNGTFFIVRSATNTMYNEQFGTTGDDPSVVGDYDGDNRDDIAVYRSGATTGAQSFWYYRPVGAGGFTTIPWGQNGDFPAPGDYDGDGKYDFVVQRADSNGTSGRFWTRLATGAQSSQFFGLATDTLAPGDYDDDGKTDMAVVRDVGGSLQWIFEPSATAGITEVADTWGVSTTDDIVQGDYDGDGRTDYAVWRRGSPSVFYIMTVGTRVISVQPWGEANDIAAANYNVR